jgi:hypothetical protein
MKRTFIKITRLLSVVKFRNYSTNCGTFNHLVYIIVTLEFSIVKNNGRSFVIIVMQFILQLALKILQCLKSFTFN